MCTKYVHQVCAPTTCTMYAHKVCAPSIKTCALCTMHRSAQCTPLGGPYEHQVCRLPTRSTGSLPQAWWAYSCPDAPANQVQSAITELICSTSMHCNGAKNIACLPTHGEANKSPDLRVGTITLDLMPMLIDALDRPLCDKPSGWSRSLKKKNLSKWSLKGEKVLVELRSEVLKAKM